VEVKGGVTKEEVKLALLEANHHKSSSSRFDKWVEQVHEEIDEALRDSSFCPFKVREE